MKHHGNYYLPKNTEQLRQYVGDFATASEVNDLMMKIKRHHVNDKRHRDKNRSRFKRNKK